MSEIDWINLGANILVIVLILAVVRVVRMLMNLGKVTVRLVGKDLDPARIPDGKVNLKEA